MSRLLLHVPAVAALLLSIIVSPAIAQRDIRTERVHFKKGASSAVVEGSLKGYEIIDYILAAQKGQYMNVSMTTDNYSNYFNILAPGETEVAFFNGSTSDNQYEGILPESGDYKIRIYQMRSAARLNEVANYQLEMIITNADDHSAEDSRTKTDHNDTAVQGTKYSATGNIQCSAGKDQPTASCPFGVTREGYGNGIVIITKADGSTRAVLFENGIAVGADASKTDIGDFSANKKGDLNIIHIGDERYEIPNAVIYGD